MIRNPIDPPPHSLGSGQTLAMSISFRHVVVGPFSEQLFPSPFRPIPASNMPGADSGDTCWREVTARLHVSLSPQELASGGKTAATRIAFQSLLMRYCPELRGVAVAHRGGLTFKSPAFFVGASPYAHLVATARLLLFSPPRGAELVGVVTHVGPDHVGLSVLQAFHAVLPLEPLREYYGYDYRIGPEGLVRKWRCLQDVPGFGEDVSIGRQIRFIVEGIKPSQSGLFQIIASLNEANRNLLDADVLPPLGVLNAVSEVVIATESDTDGFDKPMNGYAEILEDDDAAFAQVDAIIVSKRSSASRALASSLPGQDPLMGIGSPFGDALMAAPSTERRKSSKKKSRRETSGKRRHSSGKSKETKVKKSVKFEGIVNEAKDEPQDVVMTQVPVLTQTDLGSQNETPSTSKSKEDKQAKKERRERKKREKEARRRAALERANLTQQSEGKDSGTGVKDNTGTPKGGAVVSSPQQSNAPAQGRKGTAAGGANVSSGEKHDVLPERRNNDEQKESPKLMKYTEITSGAVTPSTDTDNVTGTPFAPLPGNSMAPAARKPRVDGTPNGLGRDAMRADAVLAVDVGRRAEQDGAPRVVVKHEFSLGEAEASGDVLPQSQDTDGTGGSGKPKKHKKRKREVEILTPGGSQDRDGGRKKKKTKKPRRKSH